MDRGGGWLSTWCPSELHQTLPASGARALPPQTWTLTGYGWWGGRAQGAFCGSSGEGANSSLWGWLDHSWASEGLRMLPGEDTGWTHAEK